VDAVQDIKPVIEEIPIENTASIEEAVLTEETVLGVTSPDMENPVIDERRVPGRASFFGGVVDSLLQFVGLQ
jgi:hypothetical protein